MPSFQIALSPTKRAAGRFTLAVRRGLQKALVEEQRARGVTQSDIAREIGVHRSVINRELRGEKDMTLGRVAELARALGRRAVIGFPKIQFAQGRIDSEMLAKPRSDSNGRFVPTSPITPVSSGASRSSFSYSTKALETA